MDHVIAENRGTLGRDGQRKRTLISLYYQEKQREQQRHLAPKPAHPSQCHSLQDARRFLNDAVMLVDRYMKQLTEEHLMSRLQRHASSAQKQNENENDDDQEQKQEQPQENSDVASVRVINAKLHDALVDKDSWERRVAELDAKAKGQNVAEVSQALAAMVRRRKKGYYGAARFLPEALRRSAQIQAQKRREAGARRQREDHQQSSLQQQSDDDDEFDDDDDQLFLEAGDDDEFSDDDDDDGEGEGEDDNNLQQGANSNTNDEDDEIGAFLRLHNVEFDDGAAAPAAAATAAATPKPAKKPPRSARSLKNAPLFSGLSSTATGLKTDAFAALFASADAVALNDDSSNNSNSLIPRNWTAALEQLEVEGQEQQQQQQQEQRNVAASALPSSWNLGVIPSEAEIQKQLLEAKKARLRSRLQQE